MPGGKRLGSVIFTIVFCALLLVAAAEDIKQHKVSNRIIGAVCLLGAVNICIRPKDRWETIALTCLFLCLLILLYFVANHIGQGMGGRCYLGGADVKLALGSMLFLGWEKALYGMFFGLAVAAAVYTAKKIVTWGRKNGKKDASTEIPLVPWIACGLLVVSFVV